MSGNFSDTSDIKVFIDLFPTDNQEGVLIDSARELLSFLNPQSREALEGIINEIPRGCRKKIFDICASHFLNPHVNSFTEVNMFLSRMEEISQDDRVDAIERAAFLFSHDMTVSDKVCLIEAISEISEDDRDEVLDESTFLFTEKMSAADKIDIIEERNDTLEDDDVIKWP